MGEDLLIPHLPTGTRRETWGTPGGGRTRVFSSRPSSGNGFKLEARIPHVGAGVEVGA